MPHSSETTAERTLAIVNARVWTGDEQRPWADAVLVRGARIIGVGSSAEIRKRAGSSATVIDAKALMVVPSTPNGRIAAGFPASISLIERAMNEPPLSGRADVAVLSLENGIVVVDRDSLVS